MLTTYRCMKRGATHSSELVLRVLRPLSLRMFLRLRGLCLFVLLGLPLLFAVFFPLNELVLVGVVVFDIFLAVLGHGDGVNLPLLRGTAGWMWVAPIEIQSPCLLRGSVAWKKGQPKGSKRPLLIIIDRPTWMLGLLASSRRVLA